MGDDETWHSGISMPQDLHDRAMDGADGYNKSERFRKLIRLGIATEEAFEAADLPPASEMHRVEVSETLRTALEETEFE